MDLVTSSLCAIASSLGKKSNEEIISPDIVGANSLGRPSKRTRQTMKKKVVEVPEALGVVLPSHPNVSILTLLILWLFLKYTSF